jgi:tRNA dimethylallyltransferase
VGGTSYWLQNLLFPNRIVTETAQDPIKSRAEPDSMLKVALDGLEAPDLALFQNLPDRPPIATTEAEETFRLWKLLDKLDPEMAARWHWKDSRKVLRNLEIMVEKGQKASEVIKQQDFEPLDSRLDLLRGVCCIGIGHLTLLGRYRSLVLWPYTIGEVLNPRLDKRVDQMIEVQCRSFWRMDNGYSTSVREDY